MKSEIPEFKEFQQYAFERIKMSGEDPFIYTDFIRDKYDAWKIAGWKKSSKKNGGYVNIISWKPTLIQTLIYRQKNRKNNVVQRAEIIKPTRNIMQIENEIILNAFSFYKQNSTLELKHEECFNFLYSRGIFKKPNEIIEKTGKPWQSWYNSLKEKTIQNALFHAIDKKMNTLDRNLIRNGNHFLVPIFGKLEALKVYFNRFENEESLKIALNESS